MKTKSTFLLLALSLLALPAAFAADRTWDRGGSVNSWTNATNWVGDVAPVGGDALFFAGSGTGNNNDFTANTQFNGITFNAGASAFTLAGNAINLAGNIANNSSTNQTINLAMALLQNIIVNTGTVGTTNSGGTTLGGAISGDFSLEKAGSGRLLLNVANTFTGGVRISDGTLAINNVTSLGTGAVTLGSSGGSENVMLALAGSVSPTNNIVVSAGTGTRTIQNQAGGGGTMGAITLEKDVVFDSTGGGGFTLQNRITGTNTITLRRSSGTGTMGMQGSTMRASFTGTFIVETNAVLVPGNTGGNMDISGAALQLDGLLTYTDRNPTVGGLNGGGLVDVTSASSTRVLTLGGSGTYAFSGNFRSTNTGLGGLTVRLNYGAEKGTQTLSGSNNFTGETRLNAGRLVLDYSAHNTSKLADTNLFLRGGILELSGGSHTELVTVTTNSGGGQVNILRSNGTSTLNLGAISSSSTGLGGNNYSGVVNFGQGNIATTTTAISNGILGGTGNRARFTVGGANWATVDGSSNIVALNSYSAFVNSGGSTNENYLLTGSASAAGNLAFNTLKIETSGAGQSLDLGTRTLSLNMTGLLFTGADDYAITSATNGGISSSLIVHHYGSGVLTLGRLVAETFEHAGTGKTVLTTASGVTSTSPNIGFYLSSGTVQFSANNQLGGSNVAVRLHSGTLIADTTGGDISLTNASGAGRGVSFGTDVPTIDVIGGNTLVLSGVVSSDSGLVTPVIFGSATSSGTIQLFGTNSYTGDTRLDGVRLSVNSANSLGSTNDPGLYKIIFSRDSTLNTTTNITSARYYEINSAVTGTIETDANTTLTQNGTIAGAGNLRKSGTGTLTLGGTNTYTGATTISNGTLLLAATGSIDRSSGINLGSTNSPGILDVSAKSSFLLGSSQSLSGHGTVNLAAASTLTIAGALAPGNSAGIITVTNGNVALTGSTTTTMEVAGSGGVAGADFDQLNVTSGSLTYGGALTITNWGGFDIASATASYNLFDFSGTSGNFASVNVNGFGLTFESIKWTGTNSGIIYDFTLSDGVLAVTVPEPSTYVLLVGAGLAGVIARMRRRRRS